MTSPTMPGAEPMSHVGTLPAGALVIHGFTGNPGSMRGLADAFVAANFHVEMPLLAGHGTHVDDMMPTRWSDWAADAEAAYQRLASRVDKVVVLGLSMGGALTLRVGADHPEVAGLVCVNPLTNARGDDAAAMSAMLVELADSGTESFPAIGSDIADPSAKESAYDATPVRPLVSLFTEGVAPLADEYPSMRIPLLLMNSPQDHVVQPEQADFLATTYGGVVARVTLERSFHVATQDYDKDLIIESALAFAKRVTT